MSDCCDDRARIEERIAAHQATIVAADAAIVAVLSGAQSYSLDTGQTRQVVTRANLSEIRNLIDYLEGEISRLQARLGCGQLQVRPAW